jgi:hypothetical protein
MFNISRRSMLAAGLVGIGCTLTGRAVAEENPFDGQRMFKDVGDYAGFGDHRTGLPGDQATTGWLRSRLASMGYACELHDFGFELFEPQKTHLKSPDGRLIPLLPAWQPVPTRDGGLSGVLSLGTGEAHEPGGISLVAIPYMPAGSFHAKGQMEPITAAIAAGAGAVIAITEGPTGEVIAMNASPDLRWPVPVVLTAPKEGEALRRLALQRATVRLVSEGRSEPSARAHNLIARKPGSGRRLVISTPKSGWFACAGERGSGIAVALALASWAVSRLAAPVTFISTSGHEFEGLGGKLLLKDHAPAPDDVALWVHIGANVACNAVSFGDGPPKRLDGPSQQRGIQATEALIPLLKQAFAGQVGYEKPIQADPARAIGEAAVFLEAGYAPLIGLVGAHPLHHTPMDLPAIATSPDQLVPVARALAQAVRGIMR